MERPLLLYVTHFCDFTQVYILPIQIKELFPYLDEKGNRTYDSLTHSDYQTYFVAYNGFFTANAILRDRKFAKFWLENSEAFHVLMNRRDNVRINFELVQELIK